MSSSANNVGLKTRIDSWYRVAWEKQSYVNMLYLLVSFPLGIVYFVFLMIGIVASVGSSITLGIPVLIFVIYALRRLAEFERTMAIAWLHVDMRPMPPPLQAGLTWWERLRANLSDPVTWRSLAYLLTKFPLGILSLVITCTLFVLTVGLACVSLIVGLFAVLPLYFSGILSDRKMRRQLVLTSLNSLTET